MRKLIIIILGLISVAYGQKYQSMPQAGYGPVKRIQHDSVLTIPLGIERLRNLSDGRDSGQIRYNPSDSSMYVYTGHTWVKCGRSELSALAPLYAYNDTTIAIDTTSSEGVATKWDLSQVSGGGGNGVDSVKSRGDTLRYFIGGDSTYIANFGVKPDLQGALNNGSEITSDYVNIFGGAENDLFMFEGFSSFEINSGYLGISANIYASATDSIYIATPQLRLNLPSAGANKVLTSDANGVATWQDAAADSSIYATHYYVDSSLNNYGTFIVDRYINGNQHLLTIDSTLTTTITSIVSGANDMAQLLLDAGNQAGTILSYGTDSTTASFAASGDGTVNISSVKNTGINQRTSGFGIGINATNQQTTASIFADSVRIDIPSKGLGKVLTSNELGTATWQTLTDIDNEPIINAMQALGSTYKSTTVGVDVRKIVAAQAFNSGTVYYMVTWIPNDTTLTGVSWYQTVAGNYTASGYNGVGLYSYSAGTWTLVASSTNDNNIWTATANTYATKDFTTPYRASKGVYAIAFTYNRSAVTTAPTIGRGGVLTNAAVSSIGTNSAKLYSSSSGSSLPSTIAASSQSTVNTPYFLALY